MIDKNSIYLGFTIWYFLRCAWWFNIYIPCYMILTVKLMNISIISHSYCFFLCVLRTLKIYSHLILCMKYSITIIIMLYFRSPEPIYLIIKSLLPFDKHLPFPLLPSTPSQPLPVTVTRQSHTQKNKSVRSHMWNLKKSVSILKKQIPMMV